MSSARDWLQWTGPGSIIQKSAAHEPSKPAKPVAEGGAGESAGQQGIEDGLKREQLEALLEAEPQAYEAGVQAWLVQQCVFRDRAWGGLAALHRDYCLWCRGVGNEVPAGRRTFRGLLLAEGFAVTAHEMVYGLLLAEDLNVGREQPGK